MSCSVCISFSDFGASGREFYVYGLCNGHLRISLLPVLSRSRFVTASLAKLYGGGALVVLGEMGVAVVESCRSFPWLSVAFFGSCFSFIGDPHESRILAGYYFFDANISFTF